MIVRGVRNIWQQKNSRRDANVAAAGDCHAEGAGRQTTDGPAMGSAQVASAAWAAANRAIGTRNGLHDT